MKTEVCRCVQTLRPYLFSAGIYNKCYNRRPTTYKYVTPRANQPHTEQTTPDNLWKIWKSCKNCRCTQPWTNQPTALLSSTKIFSGCSHYKAKAVLLFRCLTCTSHEKPCNETSDVFP